MNLNFSFRVTNKISELLTNHVDKFRILKTFEISSPNQIKREF